MVTTHDKLIIVERRRHIVEVVHLYQAATLNVVKSRFTQRITNKLIVRRNQQFNGVF